MKPTEFNRGQRRVKNCIVIVAHPDDETLWAGGTILSHPLWNWLVVCLCRKSDRNRALRFEEAVTQLNADGVMGDLDDGPEQYPLDSDEVENAILKLLPDTPIDLIITHNPQGEYTRHLRHEETGTAVIRLWESGRIVNKNMWLFAYEDGKGRYFPKPVQSANIYRPLDKQIWNEKYGIMTTTYGFNPDSWEAQTTPKAEAFWQFKSSFDAKNWLIHGKRLI
ncbi:MAG: PIG-L family deacetylase [Marinoscillum sp.]